MYDNSDIYRNNYFNVDNIPKKILNKILLDYIKNNKMNVNISPINQIW